MEISPLRLRSRAPIAFLQWASLLLCLVWWSGASVHSRLALVAADGGGWCLVGLLFGFCCLFGDRSWLDCWSVGAEELMWMVVSGDGVFVRAGFFLQVAVGGLGR